MTITNENKVRIFKKVTDDKTHYSLGLVKKKQDGTYENGYIMCQFRNDVEVEDKTDIYIKEAWLSFYKKDKITVPYIFINKFETIEQTIEESKSENINAQNIEITDEDLPF